MIISYEFLFPQLQTKQIWEKQHQMNVPIGITHTNKNHDQNKIKKNFYLVKNVS